MVARKASGYSPARALKIAEEVLGPDYAKAQQVLVEGMPTPKLLVEAHSTMGRAASPGCSHPVLGRPEQTSSGGVV
jgi:hypothetical protein